MGEQRAQAQVERFAAELAQVGGQAHPCADREEALRHVLRLIERENARRLLMTPSPFIDELDLRGSLVSRGIEIIEDPVINDRFREIEVGITGVLAAVAESGTLLLGGAPASMWQWASLLPRVHIALLRADQIRTDLDGACVDLRGALAEGATELVWVTGPSRTADIAATPILGMHGPTELHAVILP